MTLQELWDNPERGFLLPTDPKRSILRQKEEAHNQVSSKLVSGKLVRSATCETCGKRCITHAHHHSYSPEDYLDVTWLCIDCHNFWHRK